MSGLLHGVGQSPSWDMVWYLIKKHLVTTIVVTFALAVLPLTLMGTSVQETIPKAVFWSALIAPAIIYREFQTRRLWPLYDNLRLPKYPLLGLLAGFNVVVSIMLWIWTN
ncbi:MAG TPA: hypothetical protein VFG50_14410 [Rhodothermales bacterium]|nr:hypothetical protein [Rhodothermales bacterium]